MQSLLPASSAASCTHSNMQQDVGQLTWTAGLVGCSASMNCSGLTKGKPKGKKVGWTSTHGTVEPHWQWSLYASLPQVRAHLDELCQ